MSDVNSQARQAEDLVMRGLRQHEIGNLAQAIAFMRQAVLLYAVCASTLPSPGLPPALRRKRADACRWCGDFLFENESFAEAANIFQEAVDHYAQLEGEEADQAARRCAQQILVCVQQLKTRPYDRLHLLIAPYEHSRQQYALTPNSEWEQAGCVAHIARILHRRERYQEAVERYQEALTLYQKVPVSPVVGMACAECHHRLGTLLAYRLHNLLEATLHFREAITLYAEYEPYVYGIQEAYSLCQQALTEIEMRLDPPQND